MNSKAGYLLDTNVVSELRKRRADAGVVSFLERTDKSELYLSVLTLGELRKGVAARRRNDLDAAQQLTEWVDGLEVSFADRIFGIDGETARLWGEWCSERPRPVTDTLLAATAARHGLVFVTRNLRDVSDLKVELLNPWSEDTAVSTK